MRLILFFLLILANSIVSAHPLHLSVTNITIRDKEIRISMNTYRDDLETAYFHYHSKTIDFNIPENRTIPWLSNYLEETFRLAISQTSNPLVMEMDTIIVSGDNMTIEFHAGVPDDLNSLYIYNVLLTDIFPDQSNLVMIGIKNRETGIKFDIRKHDEEISLR